MKNLFNYIPLDKCKHGYLYIIDARNSHIGIYNKYSKGFIILRTKFNHEYLFTEYHWDIGGEMKDFGTVKPIEIIEKTNFRITKLFNDFKSERPLNEKIFDYLKIKRNIELYHDKFIKFITNENELMSKIYKEDLKRINDDYTKNLDEIILNYE